jgi:mRNA degradation ribonuclease J1/J2
MELVTLGHVTLNRVGSASYPGRPRKQIERVSEIPDGNVDSLRELVLAVAEEHGESRDALQRMWQERNSWNHTGRGDLIVFNIHGPSTQYSDAYAICHAHPALKIGGRYFKLEEVAVG